MAEKNDNHKAKVREVALKLFDTRSAFVQAHGVEHAAIRSFMDAETFLEIAERFDAGDLKDELAPPWGADAFAPKLPRNHPINMVSREWGDKARVQKINEALKKNADPNYAYSEGDLNWEPATTRRARELFPSFAN